MSSIPLLNTNTTILVRMAKALWNVAPGYSILQNYVSYANSNGINATVNALGDFFSTLSNSALAARICTNLGMTGDAYTAGVAYLEGQFNANTLANRGKVVSDAMTLLSQQTSNAVLSTVATQFNAAVLNAETYSSNSANTSVSTTAAASGGDLTTSAGETITGSAGDDTFAGITMLTLQDGDIVIGGAGTDTLNIQARGTGNDILTTLSGVEIVNIDMRSAQTFDTALWSGVQTVSVAADSATDKTLTISNARSFDTEFKLNKAADLDITYDDTAGVNTARFAINNLASGDGTIRFGLGAGVEHARLNVSGTNLPTTVQMISATNLATVTLIGSGSMGTLDLGGASITGVSFAGFTGAANVRVSASTSLNFTGNDANNTLTIGGSTFSLTSGDVLNGGNGTDTLSIVNLTSAGASLGLSGTTNFEAISINASGVGGAITQANMKQFDTITIVEASSTTDITFKNLSGGANITLRNTLGSDYDFTYTGTTTTTEVADINIRSGGHNGTLTVSGADTLDILHDSKSASTTFTTVNLTSGTETLQIAVGNSGTLDISSNLMVSGTTSMTFRASGDALLDINAIQGDTTDSFERLAATSLVVNVDGNSAELDIDDFALFNSGLATVTIVGASGGEIEMDVIDIARDANTTVSVTLTDSATLGSAGEGFEVTIASSGTMSYTASVGSGSMVASAISVGAAGHLSALSVTVASNGGDFIADDITAARVGAVSLSGAESSTLAIDVIDSVNTIGAVTLTHTSSGTVTVGNIDASGISTISITGGAESIFSIGSLTAPNSIGEISGTLGRSAALTVTTTTITSGTIGVTGFAGVNISSIGASGGVTIGDISVKGNSASTHIGGIYVSGGLETDISIAAGAYVSAVGDIGAITLVAGGSGFVTLGEVESEQGSIGNIVVTAGVAGGVSVGNIIASAENIGSITIDGGSAVTLGNIRASGSVGAITVNGSGIATTEIELEAKTFGAVTFNTDAANLSFTATPETGAFTVGAVSIDASAVTLDFGSANGAATIESITITGSGLNQLSLNSAAAVTNGIFVTGSGMTIVQAGDLVAGTTISLKGSSNTLIYNDNAQGGFVEFRANTGVDAIVFTSGQITSAVASGAMISNFQFSGSRLDKLYFGTTATDWGLNSADGMGEGTAQGALGVVYVNTADTVVNVANSATETATSVIILGTSVDAGSVISALAWLGDAANGITAGSQSTLQGSAEILLMWYNNSGQNTQLHLIDVTSTWAATFSAGNTQSTLIARFNDDIRLYSGSDFSSMFNLDE